MTRDEFEKTVRAMRAEGVPVSMPNLMVRTELPRATIEQWLREMDDPTLRAEARDDERPRGKLKGNGDDDDPRGAGVVDDLMGKVNDLKDDLVRAAAVEVVKEKLGLGGDDVTRSKRTGSEGVKDLRVGGVLGLVAGPLGLLYSAPMKVAVPWSVGYVAVLALISFLPLGPLRLPILFYLLPMVHMGAGVAGAAYTWRYNRTGKRATLFPSSDEGKRGRRG